MYWEDLLNALLTNMHQQQFDHAKRLRCGECKITLQQIVEVGKIGCPQCYGAFSFILKHFVEQMQFTHVGKRPKNAEIKELEQQAVAAALEGRFEDASSIKDEIKRLRNA